MRSTGYERAQQFLTDDWLPPNGRWFYPGVFVLFLFSTVVRLALTLNRELDVDEFEHLHAAWMVSRHFLPYRDFFENHTPLFYYLLLPLFRIFAEGPALVIFVRIIMSLSAFGILLMTYKLARMDHDRTTSALAVLSGNGKSVDSTQSGRRSTMMKKIPSNPPANRISVPAQ